jgi:NADH-quinone oxidoreductase E subunit
MLSEKVREKITQLVAKYPERDSVIMPAIMLAQKENNNHLSEALIKEVADILRVKPGKVYSIATFYSMYNLKPVGKYHLQVDTNIPATLMGAEKIVRHLEKRLGIKVGETTPDGLFTLSVVECLASCGTCPVIQVNDRYYENMDEAKTDALLKSLKKGKMPEIETVYNFSSKCNILLKNRGVKDAIKIDVYKTNGGYRALAKARGMKPADIVKEVKESDMRGRGGAGFPTGVKWGFIPTNSDRPVYLICNADEGEPGTFKDRQIMEYDPHLVIEGMAIAALGIQSKLGFIYIRGEFSWIADILETAVEEAKAAGELKDFDIIVHRGAGAYICGEETALIESLEGKRGQPRMKPPFPAVNGLYNSPTIVNNVETLASVPFIIEHGAAAYKKFGTPKNSGCKIFGISGNVNAPGTYEYPLGVPFTELLEAAGGVKGKLKAAIVGGLSVAILTAEELKDLNLDYDSCAKHGTALGSGGIMVINDEFAIPELALRTIKFYAHESCGKCVPCKEGSTTVKLILEKIVAGKGNQKDLDALFRIVNTVKGLTLCPVGEAWSVPIKTMVEKFKGEFEKLLV